MDGLLQSDAEGDGDDNVYEAEKEDSGGGVAEAEEVKVEHASNIIIGACPRLAISHLKM